MLQVSEEVAGALRERLQGFPSRSIVTGSPKGESAQHLPLIFVYSPEFTFEDSGLGGGGSLVSEEVEDELRGDGRTVTFKLSRSAQRPLRSVESPRGTQLTETSDFKVDYRQRNLSFKKPPRKGTAVVIRYLSAASAGKTRSIRLKVVCNIEIWGSDEKSVDGLVVDAIKAILLSQDVLSAKGITLAPSRGFTLGRDDGLPEGVRAQRVMYAAETYLEAREFVPRIEEIEVKQKSPL